jgi:flagellum-specific ATP synthase
VSGELISRSRAVLAGADLARCHGRVSNLIGLIIEATGLQAEVGEVCLVGTDRNR